MRWAILVVLAGCYQPNAEQSCTVTCGPGGTCPGSLTCSDGVCKDHGACPANDAGPDAPDAENPQFCYGTTKPNGGLFHICVAAEPMDSHSVNGTTLLDTDSACTMVVPQSAFPADDACVLIYRAYTIGVGSSVRAIGTRPLVIIGTQAITIAGDFDASSNGGNGAGANARACGPPMPAFVHGGGAGGSFGGVGGFGGDGENFSTGHGVPGSPTGATIVRGGCPGGMGSGSSAIASGGGAVYLISANITVTSTINASGAGGTGGMPGTGAGGGGSGGLIGLDTPMLASPGGGLVANGGGGGCGGTGSPGADGAAWGTGSVHAAARGCQGNPKGGDGGVDNAAAGSGNSGVVMSIGGGGGGGGVGAILLTQGGSFPNRSP